MPACRWERAALDSIAPTDTVGCVRLMDYYYSIDTDTLYPLYYFWDDFLGEYVIPDDFIYFFLTEGDLLELFNSEPPNLAW